MAALLRGLLTTDTTSPAGDHHRPFTRPTRPADGTRPPSPRRRWAWPALSAAVATLAAALATASGELLALGLLGAAAAVRMLDRGMGGSFTRTGGPEPPPARAGSARPAGPPTRAATAATQTGDDHVTIIERSALPGIGMRYSLATVDGRRLAVICHASGRRDLLVYPSPHAEVAHSGVSLTSAQAHEVAELLHTLGVVDRLAAAGQFGAVTVAGLPVPAGGPYAGRRLGELVTRLPAGVSVLAVIHDGDSLTGPGPDVVLQGEDVLVVAGGRADLAAAAESVTGHPT
ncbi:cation:proton antiporter regulatory subunit [Catellatospora coxensis]|uniref:RCK C-terminal domain-containing protein n=1 Tax=Catellatospora coxensis TaxID=310354 RepID=A0A8J3P7C0_9ACTN|nr:TrkA C-terminal domain-containing protein [Catellatospora coxensis]GIG06452.1 hypothetical protein Cco03nite_31520 [Catellatospora coxensis]